MSYVVPRDKPNKCTSCPFIDKITYDCRLMYSNDYPDFETQYNHCPLVEEVVFDMEQVEMVDKMIEKNKKILGVGVADFLFFKNLGSKD